MGVGPANVDEIGGGEEVEDEPVVALAQDLDGNAAGLLRDQERAQIVLSAFLHPGDVRLGRRWRAR